MAASSQISFVSPELVCFHEAGHVATAIAIGASVQEVKLTLGPTPFARTRVMRTAEQSPFIACGGFAAEYHLFNRGRLRNRNGSTVSSDEFFHEAKQNAFADIKNFATGMEEMGMVVRDTEVEFTQIAVHRVCPNIDFGLVENLSAKLLAQIELRRDDLAALERRRSRWASDYRLCRMIGYARVRSLIETLKRQHLR